jgi:ERCC4-type nuclease
MKAQPHSSDSKFTKEYVLKPTVIPENMVVVVDSREQRPLFTRPPKGLLLVRDTLTDGDYSLRGLTDKICFERKSKDIFSYCTSEQPKTKKKMERFKSFDFVGLIIEMKEHELFQFQTFTQAHPESIRGALISFEIRYNIHIFYGSRESCARWMLDRMSKFYRMIHEV